jgi:cell division protein FtsB
MFTSGGKIKAVLHNERALRVFMMALTLAFGVLYVVQVNAASTKGFTVRDLEQTNQDMRQENEKLAAEIDRLRSLASVSERETFLGLIKVNDISYIKAGNGAVALR